MFGVYLNLHFYLTHFPCCSLHPFFFEEKIKTTQFSPKRKKQKFSLPSYVRLMSNFLLITSHLYGHIYFRLRKIVLFFLACQKQFPVTA
jgi:hypothetical protein